MAMPNKIIAIVGPTASGKSALAVDLALAFGGEIISADSRQIYKGLNLSTGKIAPEETKGVPHHLLDIADLRDPQPLTLSQYLKLARVKIQEIFDRKKIPFIVGGTGLYVTAVLEGYEVPEVPPNPALRGQLEGLSLEKLRNAYRLLDPEGFKKLDISNPRRLLRAIEVVTATKKSFFSSVKKIKPNFEALVLAIDLPWTELKQRIDGRLTDRYQAGMLEEIKKLLAQGVPAGRLENLGLEMKWMRRLTDEKRESESGQIFAKAEQKILAELLREELAYARRQITWWRKKDVTWVASYTAAREHVKQ